jgi:hypothetical protein
VLRARRAGVLRRRAAQESIHLSSSAASPAVAADASVHSNMRTIQNPRLRGRRLEPVEWRVREAFSPFWLGWGLRDRWWALLICDEGLAAFEWPAKKYWDAMLRVGLRAGLAHAPSTIDGDNWPLSENPQRVESRRALLFPRQELTGIDVYRRRFLSSQIRLFGIDGERWTFTAADPRLIAKQADTLAMRFGATRSGHWPAAG